MSSQGLLSAIYLALSLAMIAWDVLMAGRIAKLRKIPRGFQAITGIAGLLLIPALVVGYTAQSLLYGRAIILVAWLWPFTALLFVVQTIYALARRLVTPLLGFPLLVYNIIIAFVALTKFAIAGGHAPTDLGLALNAAQASMLGNFFRFGDALWNPIYLQVPIFAPSLPARWGFTRLARVALAGAAIAMTALVVVELPGAFAGIKSYAVHDNEKLQEHPDGDFKIGLKIFPDLRSGPPPLAITSDLQLADTHDVDRIARRLKPDYLIPATDPLEEGGRILREESPQYWIDYFMRAARVAHYIYPRIKVAVPISSYGTRDSTLYAWAARPGTPIDAVAFSLFAGFDGARSLDTHMRVAQRWMRQFPKPKDHWVFAGGYPLVHGEEN